MRYEFSDEEFERDMAKLNAEIVKDREDYLREQLAEAIFERRELLFVLGQIGKVKEDCALASEALLNIKN